MCGIAGIINFNNKPVNEHSITSMMRRMKHRGPDDDGIYMNNSIGLGFVRLSILDLSKAGHQPMFDTSGRYLIIHNGEIFNFLVKLLITSNIEDVSLAVTSQVDTSPLKAVAPYCKKHQMFNNFQELVSKVAVKLITDPIILVIFT